MPRRAFVPRIRTRPPTTIVGSKPASVRIIPVSDVVVVLPCVPAMATPCFRRMISASISARRMTGIPRARASATSRFDSSTAEETTSRSASFVWVASWPRRCARRASGASRCSPTGRDRSPRSRAASRAAGSRPGRSSRPLRRRRNGGGAAAETSSPGPPPRTTGRTMSFAACGCASLRAFCAHPGQTLARSENSSSTATASRLDSRSSSLTLSAAPASDRASALASWCPSSPPRTEPGSQAALRRPAPRASSRPRGRRPDRPSRSPPSRRGRKAVILQPGGIFVVALLCRGQLLHARLVHDFEPERLKNGAAPAPSRGSRPAIPDCLRRPERAG